MTKEEAQDLYKGKTFYIKRPDGTLDGPREDIHYTVPVSFDSDHKYKFLQIVDGTPIQAFTEDEIVVRIGEKQ